MAGGFSAQWKTIGSNTNSTVNSGDSGGGVNGIGTVRDNIDIRPQTTNQVRHECTMWMVDDTPTFTPDMDWAINTDFTVVINGTVVDLNADPGAVEVVVQGSVDGANYIDLVDLGDWDAVDGGGDDAAAAFVYDYDSQGRMPFMRLRLDGSDVANESTPFKINVFMHTT